MKRTIGLLVLVAGLFSVAFALAGDSRARSQVCPATCQAGSGSCPMPCGSGR